MSIGPLGAVAGSLAGSPLAQTKGADLERTQQDADVQQHQVQSEQRAEAAAGIGQTDGEDHETAERDADGRRPWEPPPAKKAASAADPAPRQQPQSKDTTGESGSLLDLLG